MTDFSRSFLLVATVAAGAVAHCLADAAVCRDCFDMVPGSLPHIVCREDQAIDFALDQYTDNCWLVTVHHPEGWGYVKQVPAGTYVNDSTFSQQRTSDGYDSGDLFFLAFKWWPGANDTTRRTRYGWLAIGLKDGAPAVLASEMAEAENVALVGSGFRCVDDEPEDAPKTCIELGISPFLAEADDQNGLMLYFKNPTVVAAGIDPVACTVTGRIVPAEGTRVVQPPLRFMFGIQHYMDFGTPYAHTEEYGYEMCWSQDQFQLDISNSLTFRLALRIVQPRLGHFSLRVF